VVCEENKTSTVLQSVNDCCHIIQSQRFAAKKTWRLRRDQERSQETHAGQFAIYNVCDTELVAKNQQGWMLTSKQHLHYMSL